jgi:hypothetical protein
MIFWSELALVSWLLPPWLARRTSLIYPTLLLNQYDWPSGQEQSLRTSQFQLDVLVNRMPAGASLFQVLPKKSRASFIVYRKQR